MIWLMTLGLIFVFFGVLRIEYRTEYAFTGNGKDSLIKAAFVSSAYCLLYILTLILVFL